MSDETVILPSRAMHTIDPAHAGDAVAVRDGRIVGVGAVEQLRAAHEGATIDDRYRDAVLLPGFVEAHCHSMAGAFWALAALVWLRSLYHPLLNRQ